MASGQGPRGGADDELSARVREAVEALAADLRPGAELPPVALENHLEADLGFDSLSVAELLVRVEAALGRRLPESALAQVRTVGDLVAVAADEPVVEPAPPPEAEQPPVVRGRARQLAGGAYRLVVFALIAVVVWPALAVVPGVERRWRLLLAAGRLLFAVTGTRLTVRGRERLPADGYVVVANHPSFLDPLVVAMVVPPPATFTAVEDLREQPVARLVLRRLRVELVPRSADRRRALAAAGVLRRLAAQGRRLVFFPEGRRSTSGGLERFRMGAFVVAAETGRPVVPVTIRGTRGILPVGARWPRRGSIEVDVGWPVRSAATGFDAAVSLHHQVRAQILAACDEPDHGDTFRS